MRKHLSLIIGAAVTLVAALIGAAATLYAAGVGDGSDSARTALASSPPAPSSVQTSPTVETLDIDDCVLGRWEVVSESFSWDLKVGKASFAASGAVYTFAPDGSGFKDYSTIKDVDVIMSGKEFTIHFSGASHFTWESSVRVGIIYVHREDDSDAAMVVYDSDGNQVDTGRTWVPEETMHVTCDVQRLTLNEKTLSRLT